MRDIIEKYVGMEYKHRGGEGTVDCLSLVVSFLRDNGIYLPDDDGKKIENNWYVKDPGRFVRELSKYANIVAAAEIQTLDIVIFELQGIPRHAGVVVDRNKFIHAREGRKVAVTRLKHYQKYLHSIWRVEREVN
mgnify:CR=1 FL=1